MPVEIVRRNDKHDGDYSGLIVFLQDFFKGVRVLIMQENISIVSVPFYDETMQTIMKDGKPYVAMRQIIQALGLYWGSQYNRIMRDEVLKEQVIIMKTQMPDDGQRRDMLFLPLGALNGWLFGVTLKKVKPELRDKLLRYKRESYDVLYRYWTGEHQNVMQAMNAILLEYKTQEKIASKAGRDLNIWGRKIKPHLIARMKDMEKCNQLKMSV